DSDIAAQIAVAAGLKAETTDTKVTHEYVLQCNQTDMEFLTGRASRIGYEVTVEDKTLSFGPHRTAGSPSVVLSRDLDLLEFHPRLSTVGQVDETSVRGWSAATKESL